MLDQVGLASKLGDNLHICHDTAVSSYPMSDFSTKGLAKIPWQIGCHSLDVFLQ